MPRKDRQPQRPSCRVFRSGFVGLLTVFMLIVATSAAYGASNFYWYGANNSTCRQTGEPGSPSEACSSVGAGYLATPGGHTGGLEYMSEGGIGTDLTLTTSGDYCSYARLGSELKYQDSTNEGGLSGLSMPSPYSSYQEGDKTSSAYNACQADGTYWGQAVRGPSGKGCSGEACGIGHYVSFKSQGDNDRPWSNVFGEPSLVMSVEAGVTTFSGSGSGYGGWGFICPVVEDTEPSFHGVIEYCLQEWRSAHDAPQWKNERLQECGGAGSAQVNTYFWPGTAYATKMSGSTNTFEVGSAGSGHFEAKITETNLKNAVKLINNGCTGWHLSENPANYALVGVENGLEGYYGVSAMGGWEANLQLHTEYTPRPPSATTEPATGVSETQATINGTVNPDGVDTHYHFEYGTTTSYGSSTPEGDAGSGTGSTSEHATIPELEPGMTYHYRLVARNQFGETSYGSDQTATTYSPPAVTQDKYGDMYNTFMGPGHTFSGNVRSVPSGEWQGPYKLSAENWMYSAPAVTQDKYGDMYNSFEGPGHSFASIVRNVTTGEWQGPYKLSSENWMYSAPAVTQDQYGDMYISYEGPGHSFASIVRNTSTGEWQGPYKLSAENWMYSAPAVTQDKYGDMYNSFEGPGNRFASIVRSVPSGEWQGPYDLSNEGAMYSAPAVTQDQYGDMYDSFIGPNQTFSSIVREVPSGKWLGPYVLSNPGTAY